MGYSDESLSYRVWDPVKGKVLNFGGADFDEEVEKCCTNRQKLKSKPRS